MSQLLTVIVTDSGGVEHIFHNVQGEDEVYVDLRPLENDTAVQIITRSFQPGSEKCDAELRAIFISPRRVDCIYGAYE